MPVGGSYTELFDAIIPALIVSQLFHSAIPTSFLILLLLVIYNCASIPSLYIESIQLGDRQPYLWYSCIFYNSTQTM